MSIKNLKQIKANFYWEKDKPDLSSYGVFNKGLTHEEVINYVVARANKLNVKKELAKLSNLACGSTCPVAEIDGKQYLLYYRHDIKHYCDVIFDKRVFVMD